MTSGQCEVEWTRSAQRRLDDIPEKAATACVEFIYGPLAQNPHQGGRPLRLDLAGKHSARRGDFRVIYEFDEKRRTISIIAIGHRGDVYRLR